MKTNVTYIDGAAFEKLILESGMQHVPQKGFVKVCGPKGRNAYVASTKRVGRVDLSGFEMLDTQGGILPGFVVPHCGPFGNVKQQLDFSLAEADILNNFKAMLEYMAGLEEAIRKPRAISSSKPQPAGWQKVDTSPEARAQAATARKALIEKVAKDKGVEVSKRAFPTEA